MNFWSVKFLETSHFSKVLFPEIKTTLTLLVSVGHLCILPERFANKDLNHKFGHCLLQFIGKLSLILTNYTWLEREDSQL